MQTIYLDNNGSTALDPLVADFIISILPALQANPSSSHTYGRKMRGLVSQARHEIATFLNAKPAEIIFTSGGTESVNLGIRGVLGRRSAGHVITSSVEHACTYETVQAMEQKGFEATFLSPGLHGAVTAEAVKAAIRPDTCLIALMAVNNETGVKTDIAAIAALAESRAIPFVVDGVAWLGKEAVAIPKGVSFMAFSGHKVHAPQGVGMAYVRSGVKLEPQLTGGEQEFGRRAGTENVLGILALGKAIEILKSEQMAASERMRTLRDTFERRLKDAIPDIVVNGQGERVPNVSNLAFPGVDGETLLINLDRSGVAASHGSACSSGALEPSRVLLNMGVPLELVRASLRFSLSRFTTLQEIDRACEILIRQIHHVRK